jgi:hypothetical protein
VKRQSYHVTLNIILRLLNWVFLPKAVFCIFIFQVDGECKDESMMKMILVMIIMVKPPPPPTTTTTKRG